MISQKRCEIIQDDNLKSQNSKAYPLSRKYIFGKTTGVGGQIPPPIPFSLFMIKMELSSVNIRK